MADEMNLDPQVANAIERGGVALDKPEGESGPLYRVMGDTKIVVPKHLGKLWKSRQEQAKSVRGSVEDAWREAVRYYENDQTEHRDGGNSGQSGNGRYGRGLTDKWNSTENVVFSNICTMLPLLYAKNPNVEITAYNVAANEGLGKAAEAYIDAIFANGTLPGIGLKTKARRGVFYTALMNSAYSRVGWTKKEDSNEAALEELKTLSDAYANAKSQAETRKIEGQLQALEAKLSLLTPSGPTFKVLSPFRLFIDSASIEADHSDALFMMEYDYLPTAYVNAVYGKDKNGKVVSVYEPSHVLKAGESTQGIEDDINNFSLFNSSGDDAKAQAYGYDNDAVFKTAQYTKVWWIWDKTTRRVFLYADNKWEWPLWVWDDPLKLLEFFPYDRLWFHEGYEAAQSKGEVTYYLDQQDAINNINSTIAQARNWTKNNIFYDKNSIQQEDVDSVLSGPNGTARGVDIPEGKTLKDVIFSFAPPALSMPELLSGEKEFAAINRITGINDAQRGAQFKTNTTNEAINAYQKNVDIRVDEKIDAIEDWIGKFAWKLLQIAFRELTIEDVSKIIGPDLGRNWKQITDPNELRTTLSLRVVGGSTDKPTSRAKKDEALKMLQLLGQFAGTAPYAVVIAVRIAERAFDELVMTDKDWQDLLKSITDQQNMAGAGPGGAGGGGDGQPQPLTPEAIKELIARLPEEAKAMLEQLVQKGVPPSEALKQVMAQIEQAQSEQQPAT